MRRFLLVLSLLAACDGGDEPTCEGGGIPGLEVGRELNRFLRRASEGDVSDPFDAGDSFIVVRLVESQPEGVTPFDEVRDQIEDQLKKEAVEGYLGDLKSTWAYERAGGAAAPAEGAADAPAGHGADDGHDH